MSKKEKRGKERRPSKFKGSLTHSIRKLFDQSPNSDLSLKEICAAINIKESELRKQTYNVLKELSVAGFLKETSHGTFKVNTNTKTVEGEIQLTMRGAGFVITDKDESDIFIAPQHLNHALNGDRVRVSITKKTASKAEGQVIEVLQRERTQFVGTLDVKPKFAFFIPDNQRNGVDIYVPKEKMKGAKDKDKVLVRITAWPKSSESPFGEVVEILGSKNTNDTEMIGILVNQGLEIAFPQEVIIEAEKVSMDLDPEEVKKRRDFRNITTLTIDPADAKDFDDAISLQWLENGNVEIGVHIADVSHYVQPGTALDEEALKRSNSVYLVDRVIPMLPEQLSNMACSLRPHEDKFSFSAVFEMDENGKILNEWFGKTVINSNHRFSYEEAQEIIEGAAGPYQKEVLFLDSIAKKYRKKRLKNGALNIESEEMRFELDEAGNPIKVILKTSKDAHKLVEEFMLLANKQVATKIGKPKGNKDPIPFIYRCHDKPNDEKIALFRLFIDKFHYELNYKHPDEISKAINNLLSDIKLTNEYSLIQTMAIRSMSKATYETDNCGHYGLAFPYYTHFTSPIRRYADLMVHRILFDELNGHQHKYGSKLDDIAKRISRNERKAVEAERESNKYFQALYMKERLGEEFEGTISGIADFGIFVKMNDNQCEGMIPLIEIPGDRFFFDAEKFSVVGTKTKKEYNFGDPITVKVLDVDTRKRQINLEMVEK